MKFVIKIGFTAIVAFLLQWYMPWWSVALAGFLISVILSSGGTTSFFSGFIGVGMVWFAQAFYTDYTTGSILTEKVAEILFLPNSFLLVIVTALIGGLAGGMGALTGSYLRSLFTPNYPLPDKFLG